LRRRRLFWQIFPLAVGSVAISLIAIVGYSASSLREFYVERSTQSLLVNARLLAHSTQEALQRDDAGVGTLARLATSIARGSELRLTIIEPGGKVLVDSHRRPERMDNHRHRPEVIAALEGGVGRSLRYSDTLSTEVVYVAVPVEQGGQIQAIVRTSIALSAIDHALAALRLRLLGEILLICVLAGAGAWLVARRIVRPLEDLTKATENFAAGDFSMQLSDGGSSEIASLAGAMETMARQLDDRISDLVERRNEQEAVLSSMVEGVVAIDRDARIITLNNAAAVLLGAIGGEAVGRTLQEVARTPELQSFVLEALASEESLERDLSLRGAYTRAIQAHGAPLRDAGGNRIGAVVVLNDVTKILRLETIRRDFVANVSHELKTPITSIKGFLETLADGAIDDAKNARRFVEIAARQADRLGAIIEDLLVLSRLEEDNDSRPVETTASKVLEILEGAVEVCSAAAIAKGIVVSVTCPADLCARMNAALVEQAVVNLVSNAINYSQSGSSIEVRAEADAEQVHLSVSDQGDGIEAQHLPRLFERFYRVDKARSRSIGGTGLGLAIVKHIAAAQGGSVDVVSETGRGSTFTISLPRDT
jgi:two-component system phosphate regulon sensor histidine kinase PhoR